MELIKLIVTIGVEVMNDTLIVPNTIDLISEHETHNNYKKIDPTLGYSEYNLGNPE